MPYRIDIASPPSDALERLMQLGALDIEQVQGGIAAIIPDNVGPDVAADTLNVTDVAVSAAVARDNGSVWLLAPRPVRIGNVFIAPPEAAPEPGMIRLTDSAAFGTGHHPTTVLCIEALQEALTMDKTGGVLDVGTGSGVLALTALMLGVPQAVGLDIDADALKIAGEHARLNDLAGRLQLVLGGPQTVEGTWPLVIANVLAAPLIEMAPMLVRRVGHRGRLILSGIPASLEFEVWQTYQWLGMRHIRSETRAGWAILIAQASW